MIKVTMNLTEQDVADTAMIFDATNARSKAQAVSTALTLTRFIIDAFWSRPGSQIILRSPDREDERLVMPELERVGKIAGNTRGTAA